MRAYISSFGLGSWSSERPRSLPDSDRTNRIIAWLGVPDKTHNQRSPPIAQIAYFHFYRVELIELGVDAVDARFVPLAVDLHNPTTAFSATVGS